MGSISFNIQQLNNKVFVNSVEDLPFPIGGVITLADNTTYEFNTNGIDLLGNRIVLGNNNYLLGQGMFQTFITSTGLPAGVSLFSVVGDPNVNIYLFEKFTVQQLSAGTSCFNIEGVGLFQLKNFCCRMSPSIGTFKTVNGFFVNDLCQFQDNQEGFVFDGSLYGIGFTEAVFQSTLTGGTFVKLLPSVILGFQLSFINCTFIGNGSQTSVDIDSGISFLYTQNAPITVLDNKFLFQSIIFDGLNTKSSLFRIKGNIGLKDSCIFGGYYISTPVLNSIVTQGVFEKINGFTSEWDSRGLVMTSDNQITYTFEQTITVRVTANCFVIPTVTDLPLVSIGIALNGTVLTQSIVSCDISVVSRGAFMSTETIISNLSTSDIIELFIANETSDEAVTVTKSNLTVMEI